MRTPSDLYSEIRRDGRTILPGQLKLLQPARGGADDDIIVVNEFLVPQSFEITDLEGNKRKLISGELGGHIARNRYFLKSATVGGEWDFLGESENLSDMFPLNVPRGKISPGMYILRGIATQDLDDNHVLLAEDSIVIEIAE